MEDRASSLQEQASPDFAGAQVARATIFTYLLTARFLYDPSMMVACPNVLHSTITLPALTRL